MPLSRRSFLAGSTAMLSAPYLMRGATAAVPGQPLPVPQLLDATGGEGAIEAVTGRAAFLEGGGTRVLGFSQPYLGPVLRFARGRNSVMRVRNRLDFPITCHWHGMHVPAIVDGGPQLEIAPGDVWRAELGVDQPATTLWYHSHAHGVTAEQVYFGLAGMIIVDDPGAANAGLPGEYGHDDLPLIIQDRWFDGDGSLFYAKRGPMLMHGFRGGTILVNGAVRPEASVPAGLVRLRLLNASNARIYAMRFSDGRAFHQIGSDGGLLPAPVPISAVVLGPAERAELLVDFSDGEPVSLLSLPDFNSPMGMMGGRGMTPGTPPQFESGNEGEFEIMRFAPDRAKRARVTAIPEMLAGAPRPDFGEPVRKRQFRLDMHGMMGRGMGRGPMQGMPMGFMTINGEVFDPDRIDVEMRIGETELWEIVADRMAHPFHVHGTSFQILSQNGRPAPYEKTGMKDTVLVSGRAEILVRMTQPAGRDVPFMYHCHILEHEDAGMMGQFTVEYMA